MKPREVQCIKCKAVYKNNSKAATVHAKSVHNGTKFGYRSVKLSTKPKPEVNVDTIVHEDNVNEDKLECEVKPDFGNLWNNVNEAMEEDGPVHNCNFSDILEHLGSLVTKAQHCKELYEAILTSGCSTDQRMHATNVLNSALSVSEASCSLIEQTNNFLQQPSDDIHDPANRPPHLTDSQRQYLITMGPHQPRLESFPTWDGKFSPKWYDEFEYLEYSVLKDAAFCFTCTLFPRNEGKWKEERAWVENGVRSWKKMKSKGKDRPGKLQMHFQSRAHQASVRSYQLIFSTSLENDGNE